MSHVKLVEDNLRMFFSFAMLLAEFLNACSRIQKILLLSENEKKFEQLENKAFAGNENEPEVPSGNEPEINDVTAHYPGSEDVALEQIKSKIPSNQLTGIIGPVGCGKSTFFSLLLNELDVKKGNYKKFRSFGYAAQESWIISGTIQENILLGRDLDEEKYKNIIQASCLKPDLDLLEFGDQTLIGMSHNR